MSIKKPLLLTLLLLGVLGHCCAQKLIEYSSGIGSRDPENGDIWILYRHVKAVHEGMTLTSDSAHFNTRENSFTAFGSVVIKLSDTTFIYGDRLYYDGNTRVVDIWDDTVVLVDGRTQLLANHVTYERNKATAYYTEWGHALSGVRTLDSRQGEYNSDLKEFFIYNDVVLADTSMTLLTDTLIYNTTTEVAHFDSPTHIYTDSSVIYSELGDYNTKTRFAISYRASHVDSQGRTIDSDTLYYDDGALRQSLGQREDIRLGEQYHLYGPIWRDQPGAQLLVRHRQGAGSFCGQRRLSLSACRHRLCHHGQRQSAGDRQSQLQGQGVSPRRPSHVRLGILRCR